MRRKRTQLANYNHRLQVKNISFFGAIYFLVKLFGFIGKKNDLLRKSGKKKTVWGLDRRKNEISALKKFLRTHHAKYNVVAEKYNNKRVQYWTWGDAKANRKQPNGEIKKLEFAN